MLSNDLLLGAVVIGVVVAVLAGTTILYLNPLGRRSVVFETADAAAIRGGEDVRVAGVSVGKVSGVALEANSVRITAEVSDDTFIGADSTVEVRMATAVGGYYVAIIPVGNSPLGDATIPAARVKMPYSIADVLQEVPPVTDNTDASTVGADFTELSAGLQHNATAVGSLISGLDAIARVMAQQRQQINTTLGLASEYSSAIDNNREFIFQFVRDVELIVATYHTYRAGFNETYQLLGDVMTRLIPVEMYFLDHKEEVRAAVAQAKQAIGDFLGAAGPGIDQLTALRDELVTWLTPEGVAKLGGGSILASQVCIPVPGRVC
ncbi:MlaD family protein [Nocardia asteroides]|uniref:MlaD family protein n=1 Tax=Nocardia asteroides TaxID=1824 RepID=UPI001E615816|nr:MlaD family protein [Nocardia asteroides]UGT55129.1 MlaD family protein [Nocardia asteroides]